MADIPVGSRFCFWMIDALPACALCRSENTQDSNGQIYARVIATLSFLLNHAEQLNGFYYPFLDIETGRGVNRCQVSPIDTTILLCGILTARSYFQPPEISPARDHPLSARELA